MSRGKWAIGLLGFAGGMMTRHLVVAGLVVSALAGAPSLPAAQAKFCTFVAGSQSCAVHGTVGTSAVPISAQMTCSGPGASGGISDASVDALRGHVGSRGSATKPTGGDGVPIVCAR